MEISNSLWSGSAFSGRIELYSITCNFISHRLCCTVLNYAMLRIPLTIIFLWAVPSSQNHYSSNGRILKLMSTRKAPIHFFLCIFRLLPSLNFPGKRIFFLKRPANLVGAFWRLEVLLQPTGLTDLKSEKPSIWNHLMYTGSPVTAH